jgi:hypothetical protein
MKGLLMMRSSGGGGHEWQFHHFQSNFMNLASGRFSRFRNLPAQNLTIMSAKPPLSAAAKKSAASECVQVIIRCRPLSSTEKKNNNNKIVEMDKKLKQIRIKDPSRKEEQLRTFTMDNVFDESSRQSVIFEETGKPIVESVLSGYNGTIFAYGQTGTG